MQSKPRIRDPHACEFAEGRFHYPLSLTDDAYCWGCNGRIIFDNGSTRLKNELLGKSTGKVKISPKLQDLVNAD